MTSGYIRTADRIGRVLQEVEEIIDSGRFPSDVRTLKGLIAGLSSDDEVHAALEALRDLGVVVRRGEAMVADVDATTRTAGYRNGVRDALRFRRGSAEQVIDICVALPTGVPFEIAEEVQLTTVDLRAGILNVVTSSERRVVLSAPFWDGETAEDLGAILLKCADKGVQVDLLTRQIDRSESPLGDFWLRAISHQSVRVFAWETRNADDRFGVQTFHFKCAVSDNGRSAYLGSANLTSAGLRSRMEMGAILRGPAAVRISRVVDSALRCSTEVSGSVGDAP